MKTKMASLNKQTKKNRHGQTKSLIWKKKCRESPQYSNKRQKMDNGNKEKEK